MKFKEDNDFINQIICGNCLKIMPNISNKSIDMILCDLPYGTTACRWDIVIPFEPLWKQYKRIIKDNGMIVLFGSQPFTTMLISSNMKMFKYCWVWNKKSAANILNAKYAPLKIHEDIIIFGGKNYFPQMIIKKGRWKGGKKIKSEIDGAFIPNKYWSNLYYPKSIIEFSNASQKNKQHSTQKPVALFEYLIKTYTNKGNLVLDNCAGSGTTGIACKNLGRNYILIEKERKYVEIARRRIKAIPELLF